MTDLDSTLEEIVSIIVYGLKREAGQVAELPPPAGEEKE